MQYWNGANTPVKDRQKPQSSSLTLIGQLFAVPMRLKVGLLVQDIADGFSIIFFKYLYNLDLFITRGVEILLIRTFSNYKHHNTKFLIGITSSGVILFVSEAWGCRISDRQIVIDNIPPFKTKFQFSVQEVFETNANAQLRIHCRKKDRKCKKIHLFDDFSMAMPSQLAPRYVAYGIRYRPVSKTSTGFPVASLNFIQSALAVSSWS
ncbi:hypothetical protein MAR_015577 [Mya arenaria]|uniref:DDE Tnp4 domain-containing protein n=1 Tax=Mya arenaria TaxID=6604 RepID=A0ABY7FHE5_MYAAR|nr:hypothetical protein MAR_015577 [Mya arenaria]